MSLKKATARAIRIFTVGALTLMLWGCSSASTDSKSNTLQPTITTYATKTALVVQNTPYLTNTPHPTNTGKEPGIVIPTLDFTTIPTPVPPLVAHEWEAETVLVEFGHVRGGDRVWPIAEGAFEPPPALILFSTGQFISTVAKDSPINPYEFDYYTTNLSRAESCQILNTLDQTGFLTFDEIGFHTLAMGAPSVYIKANGWKSSEVNQQALYRFVDCINNFESEGYLGCAYITESTNWRAVVDTYNFLDEYEAPRLREYAPQKFIVWVDQPDYNPSQIAEWPYASPSLLDLAQKQTCERKGTPFTLETNEVSVAWQVDPPTGFYEQDGFVLEVYSRPMVPYEFVSECGEWPQIDYEELTPPNTMSCFREDGVLPILQIP